MSRKKDVKTLATHYLGRGPDTLDREETRVLHSFSENHPISRDIGEEAEIRSTFWDRLADRVAAIGGSWAFIFSFLGILVGWMLLNTGVLPRCTMPPSIPIRTSSST